MRSKLDEVKVFSSQYQLSKDILENSPFDLSELNVDQIKSAKSTSEFFRNSIGEKNYQKFTDLFNPLGNKWKTKILGLIDKIPSDLESHEIK